MDIGSAWGKEKSRRCPRRRRERKGDGAAAGTLGSAPPGASSPGSKPEHNPSSTASRSWAGSSLQGTRVNRFFVFFFFLSEPQRKLFSCRRFGVGRGEREPCEGPENDTFSSSRDISR